MWIGSIESTKQQAYSTYPFGLIDDFVGFFVGVATVRAQFGHAVLDHALGLLEGYASGSFDGVFGLRQDIFDVLQILFRKAIDAISFLLKMNII